MIDQHDLCGLSKSHLSSNGKKNPSQLLALGRNGLKSLWEMLQDLTGELPKPKPRTKEIFAKAIVDYACKKCECVFFLDQTLVTLLYLPLTAVIKMASQGCKISLVVLHT